MSDRNDIAQDYPKIQFLPIDRIYPPSSSSVDGHEHCPAPLDPPGSSNVGILCQAGAPEVALLQQGGGRVLTGDYRTREGSKVMLVGVRWPASQQDLVVLRLVARETDVMVELLAGLSPNEQSSHSYALLGISGVNNNRHSWYIGCVGDFTSKDRKYLPLLRRWFSHRHLAKSFLQ